MILKPAHPLITLKTIDTNKETIHFYKQPGC